MIYDNNLIFSNSQAITVTAASTNVIDLQGGLAINKGTATVFGEDVGRGDGVAIPKVAAFVTTAFTAGGAGTLQIQLQGAPDTGAGEPAGTPGTWLTYAETPAAGFSLADLVVGAKLAAFDWPQVQAHLGATPPEILPRYLRLNYVVDTGPMTAGNIFAGMVLQRQDNNVGFYPSAFTVGP
jgi:hypothetical protein